MQKRWFRVLSEDEFNRLTTAERSEYLREAIDTLEELKDQLRKAIMVHPPVDVPQLPPDEQADQLGEQKKA